MAKEKSTSLATVKKERDSLKRRWQKARERQATLQNDLIQTGGVAVGAYGASWYRERYPDKTQVLGVDASVAVGAAAALTALTGAAGEATPFLLGVGQGAIAEYAVRQGAKKGAEQRQAA